MNIVDKALEAFNNHQLQPHVQEAMKILGVYDSGDLMIAFRALWMLHWIRYYDDNTSQSDR